MKRQVHPTPAEQGLDSCSVCRLVSSPEERSDISRCPRCNAKLQQRKPHSIEQCWALTIAAYLLYIPANLMTMMETGSLLGYRKDTIMSGIILLWQTDFQGIAAIVFIASILVPMFKLLALTLLLISVQRKSTWCRCSGCACTAWWSRSDAGQCLISTLSPFFPQWFRSALWPRSGLAVALWPLARWWY